MVCFFRVEFQVSTLRPSVSKEPDYWEGWALRRNEWPIYLDRKLPERLVLYFQAKKLPGYQPGSCAILDLNQDAQINPEQYSDGKRESAQVISR